MLKLFALLEEAFRLPFLSQGNNMITADKGWLVTVFYYEILQKVLPLICLIFTNLLKILCLKKVKTFPVMYLRILTLTSRSSVFVFNLLPSKDNAIKSLIILFEDYRSSYLCV